jgi:hypothetical protein
MNGSAGTGSTTGSGQTGETQAPGGPAVIPSLTLPKGGGAIRGIGEVRCQSSDRHGFGNGADRHEPRALRIRTAACSVLRLRCRKRTVRLWLEPFDPLHHAKDRQGLAQIPGCRG